MNPLIAPKAEVHLLAGAFFGGFLSPKARLPSFSFELPQSQMGRDVTVHYDCEIRAGENQANNQQSPFQASPPHSFTH